MVAAAEAAARQGSWVAGFVSYDASPAFDSGLVVPEPAADGPPRAWFGVFERRIDDPGPLPPSLWPDWTLQTTAEEHAAAVTGIRDLIAAGRTYQVNLTARALAHVTRPAALYAGLIRAQAGNYGALMTTSTHTIACASPELFFSVDRDHIVTRPMKGTARRGRWPAEDADMGRTLQQSSKNRAENVMIVDLLRNDIGRIAVTGTVTVPAMFDLERYPTVWQLTSTVEGTLPHSTDLVTIMTALFPSGSVTGAPKRSTMKVIADLEPRGRGVYCGAVGFIEPGPTLTATFAVAIRTATTDNRTGITEYGTGGGITWASDAATEWDELNAKLLQQRVEISGLFETFRGGDTHRIPRHLDRMAASAAYFGIPFDRTMADALIEGRMGRVRLDLDRAGTLSVTTAPLPPPPTRPVRLGLSREPIDSHAAVTFHKVADRRVHQRDDVDDVVLVNERGEVTQTTIANIAVRLDGRWWTPPLDSGLLPGVERARLLAQGRLGERVISVADLLRADEIALVSSLRGWRAAELYAS